MFLFHFILTKNYYLQGTENDGSQMTSLNRSDTNTWILIPTKIAGFGLSF